jgi:hypothetical protein
MGIRQKMNENPAITGGVSVGLVVLILIYILYSSLHSSRPAIRGSDEIYYSDDDGASYFADDSTQIPPYDHGGKQAVKCYVFSCNGTKFVGYLERFSTTGLHHLDAIKNHTEPPRPPEAGDKEVKMPGSGKWIPENDPKGQDIMNVKCPNGSSDTPTGPLDP